MKKKEHSEILYIYIIMLRKKIVRRICTLLYNMMNSDGHTSDFVSPVHLKFEKGCILFVLICMSFMFV